MGAGRSVARATRDLSSQSPVLLERIHAPLILEVVADSTLRSTYHHGVERIEQGICQAGSIAIELNVLIEVRVELDVLPQLHGLGNVSQSRVIADVLDSRGYVAALFDLILKYDTDDIEVRIVVLDVDTQLVFQLSIECVQARLVESSPTLKSEGFPSRATCTPKEMQDLSLHQR